MPRKSSILRKGLMLIAIPLAFQVAFAGFLLLRQERVDEAGRWAIHTKVVLAIAETMFRTLIEADHSVSALITLSDRTRDAEAAAALGRLPGQIDSLHFEVRDNPRQVARLQALRSDLDVFISQREALRKAAGGPDPAQAISRLREILGLRQLKTIRGKLDEFLAIEEGLDRRRVTELRRIQEEQIWILGVGAFGLLATGILSALVFGRSIVRRIDVMNVNVRRLAAGEKLVPHVEGHDEITALDASFHKMASELKAAAANEKRYQESIEQRSLELSNTNRELSQKSDENEMFVYSVSHDLRSPLVNLQGFGKELSMAMNDLREMVAGGEVPPAIREQALEIVEHGMAEPIRFIQTAVTRLSAIIDALLRLSRAGRVEYQRSLTDVQAIVTRVVDATQSVMVQKGAQIVIAPGLPHVWADPTAVEQVFGNLVGNALNYLDPERPGRIEISAEPSEADSGMVAFRVRDNGLGIPEAYLAKIFSIFQRVHGNVAPGEGIGLALVRRMVERHGGRIWVESTEREGSSFFVSFPGAPPAEPPPSSSETAAA